MNQFSKSSSTPSKPEPKSILKFNSLSTPTSSQPEHKRSYDYSSNYKSSQSEPKKVQKTGWAQSTSNYTSKYADTYGGIASQPYGASSSSNWQSKSKSNYSGAAKKSYSGWKGNNNWKNKSKSSPVKTSYKPSSSSSQSSQSSGVYSRPSTYRTNSIKAVLPSVKKDYSSVKKESYEW